MLTVRRVHPHEEPYMFNQEFIVDSIRDALGRDARIPHPAEIAVSEQQGTVTLRGSVGSPHRRSAAVEITKSVRGVRDVQNELGVDPLDHWEDDEVRGAALQPLMSDAAIPAGRIDVAVVNGWLTLKGEVKHQYDSNAACETVSRLPGVGGITNEIRVITAGIDG
jgi:osmotically-inducible protein OsmY